jgi:hypothetical protein
MLRFRLPMFVGLLALHGCASGAGFDAEPAHDTDGLEPEDLPSMARGVEGPAEADEPPVFLSLDEEEEDFQRRAHTPLPDDERLKVERVLDGMGMSPDEVALVGELVLHDDVYIEAADLIAVPDELVEKGKLFSMRITTTTGTPGPTPQEGAATFYAGRTFMGNKQFFRPWVQTFTTFVTPADDIILSLLRLVTSNINSAANDCLVANGDSGTLRASSAATYDANPLKARIPAVRIIVGNLDTACPGASGLEGGGVNTKGCSLGMRKKNLEHPDGETRSTMVIGPRIGLVSGNGGVTGLNGTSRRIVTHEILHTMGFAHSSQATTDTNGDGQPDSIVVLNTSAANNTISVMQNACPTGTNCGGANPPNCCSAVNDMSVDDIATLDGLYSARPGGDCNYVNDYQTIQ